VIRAELKLEVIGRGAAVGRGRRAGATIFAQYPAPPLI
jgi:hypothetical protein